MKTSYILTILNTFVSFFYAELCLQIGANDEFCTHDNFSQP